MQDEAEKEAARAKALAEKEAAALAQAQAEMEAVIAARKKAATAAREAKVTKAFEDRVAAALETLTAEDIEFSREEDAPETVGALHKSRMQVLYASENADKLDEIDSLLIKYSGREKMLWAGLKKKYGVDAVAEAFATVNRSRLTALYAQHNFEKLGDVKTLHEKYAGREEAMLSALNGKYGAPAVVEAYAKAGALIGICASSPRLLQRVDELLAKYARRPETTWGAHAKRFGPHAAAEAWAKQVLFEAAASRDQKEVDSDGSDDEAAAVARPNGKAKKANGEDAAGVGAADATAKNEAEDAAAAVAAAAAKCGADVEEKRRADAETAEAPRRLFRSLAAAEEEGSVKAAAEEATTTDEAKVDAVLASVAEPPSTNSAPQVKEHFFTTSGRKGTSL